MGEGEGEGEGGHRNRCLASRQGEQGLQLAGCWLVGAQGCEGGVRQGVLRSGSGGAGGGGQGGRRMGRHVDYSAKREGSAGAQMAGSGRPTGKSRPALGGAKAAGQCHQRSPRLKAVREG